MRSVELWVGATDDAAIPARVKARVFERYGGRCALTGRLIRGGEPWQCDHIVALVNGGRHAEDNLQPVSVDAHKIKTTDDLAIKSKVARVRAKHLGIYPKSPFKLKGRGFPKRAGA